MSVAPQRTRALAARAALFALAALAVTSAGCRRSSAHQPAESAFSAPTLLRVENNNRDDVTVYLLRGTQRARLGTVTAATTATFRLPRTLDGDAGGFRIVAEALGGRRYPYTTPLTVAEAGQRLLLTLEPTLSRSVLAIY